MSERVLRRIDRRHAGVNAREVQIRRRDRSGEILQRRERRARDLADRRALRIDERRSRADRGRRARRALWSDRPARPAAPAEAEPSWRPCCAPAAGKFVSNAPPAATAAPAMSVRRVIGVSSHAECSWIHLRRSTDAGAATIAAAALVVRGSTLGGRNALCPFVSYGTSYGTSPPFGQSFSFPANRAAPST